MNKKNAELILRWHILFCRKCQPSRHFSLDLDLPEVAGWVHDEAKSNDPHDTLRREDDSKDNLDKIVNNELRMKCTYDNVIESYLMLIFRSPTALLLQNLGKTYNI